jgi:hypothetical protein
VEGPTREERAAAISELVVVADDFAARAQAQEGCRDRSTPGTGRHHQHAHSATLWRMAERQVRTRIRELESGMEHPTVFAAPA